MFSNFAEFKSSQVVKTNLLERFNLDGDAGTETDIAKKLEPYPIKTINTFIMYLERDYFSEFISEDGFGLIDHNYSVDNKNLIEFKIEDDIKAYHKHDLTNYTNGIALNLNNFDILINDKLPPNFVNNVLGMNTNVNLRTFKITSSILPINTNLFSIHVGNTKLSLLGDFKLTQNKDIKSPVFTRINNFLKEVNVPNRGSSLSELLKTIGNAQEYLPFYDIIRVEDENDDSMTISFNEKCIILLDNCSAKQCVIRCSLNTHIFFTRCNFQNLRIIHKPL